MMVVPDADAVLRGTARFLLSRRCLAASCCPAECHKSSGICRVSVFWFSIGMLLVVELSRHASRSAARISSSFPMCPMLPCL